MTNLTALKSRIDIIDVLEKIGARTAISEAYDDEEVAVWCPFCDDADSDRPAASANWMKGLYFCYKCGFGGTIIDIARTSLTRPDDGVGDVWGTYAPSIGDAIKWLEENWPEEEDGDADPWKDS